MRWGERLIPSLLILWRSVLGCRFRILAAPFGPSITPPVCFSTAIMCPRSTSFRRREREVLTLNIEPLQLQKVLPEPARGLRSQKSGQDLVSDRESAVGTE